MTVNRVSPSSLTKWLECPRKWAFYKLAGIAFPPSKAMLRGTITHKILEDWHRVGAPIPASPNGERAMLALPFVPRAVTAPETGLEWEAFGVLWQGRVDFEGCIEETALCGDYKTTDNPARVKSSDELAVDLAATLYAHGMLARYPQARHVLLLWLYLLQRPPARLTVLHLPDARADLDAKVERLAAPARVLLKLWNEGPRSPAEINDTIPARLAECNGLGIGCDYAKHCNRKGPKC